MEILYKVCLTADIIGVYANANIITTISQQHKSKFTIHTHTSEFRKGTTITTHKIETTSQDKRTKTRGEILKLKK